MIHNKFISNNIISNKVISNNITCIVSRIASLCCGLRRPQDCLAWLPPAPRIASRGCLLPPGLPRVARHPDTVGKTAQE